MLERGHQPDANIAGFTPKQLNNLAELAARRGLPDETRWHLEESINGLNTESLVSPARSSIRMRAEELALYALRYVKRGRGTISTTI